ncbi:MAG: hypothetical protein ACI35W_04655 [Anaeroplasmataceae bacterium]
MNKVKLFTILKYLIVIVILLFSIIRGSILLYDYISMDNNKYLVGAIIYFVIMLISIVPLVMLIRKSIYKSKFHK